MSLDEALGIWAEAAQDMASASLAKAAGNMYNAVDLSNQVAEKALQSLYVLRHDRRAPYNHDLRALGELVEAPPEILADLDGMSPYHPATYLADKTPEEADDLIEEAVCDDQMRRARATLRWARQFVLVG